MLEKGDSFAQLRQKGCDGINTASRERGDSVVANPGQKVHVHCRRDYCNKHAIRRDNNDINDNSNHDPCASPSLRSSSGQFSFRDHCLFCGQIAKLNDKKRGLDVFPVRTLQFQKAVVDICKQRSDVWSSEVERRVNSALDLPAADAVYHQCCSVNFRYHSSSLLVY